jgi:hypothetical protein
MLYLQARVQYVTTMRLSIRVGSEFHSALFLQTLFVALRIAPLSLETQATTQTGVSLR